jgi:lipid-A-disaccharide synthase
LARRILIVAGESSGDLHGSNLVKALTEKTMETEIFGIGGPLMKSAGVSVKYDLTGMAVVGFIEVLRHLSSFRTIFRNLLAIVDANRPDVAILIDYPGFNMRLAKELKKRNIPVVYYISPQIWAWGMNRIKLIREYVDRMIVIFEFEKEIYEKYGVPVSFVGHPLLDGVRPTMPDAEFRKKFLIPDNAILVAILPGSRRTEVRKILPIMVKAARILHGKSKDIQFIIARAPSVDRATYIDILKDIYLPIQIVDDKTYDCINVSDMAMVCSGTATLETAILQKPMVIVYKVSFTTWLMLKPIIKTPNIGLVNVVAGEKIVNEFLQYDAVPGKIARECWELLTDSRRTARIKEKLGIVKSKLGRPGASNRAADVIVKEFIHAPSP